MKMRTVKKSNFRISTIALLIVIMIGSFQCTPEKTSKAYHNADGVQTEFLDRGVVAFTRADSYQLLSVFV
jgi:hypothetical protein